jgi:hypothetical protein
MSSLRHHKESLCDRFQDWLVDATTPAREFRDGKAGLLNAGTTGLAMLPGTPPLELSDAGAYQRQIREQVSSDPRVATSCDAFLALAPTELRAHANACGDCRAAADDLVTLRELLRDLEPVPVAGPYFAKRVMANIAAQDSTERSRIVAIWLAVPRFASRLAWVSAIAFVCACGWLYERPATPPPQSAAAFASEHLFDPPAVSPNHDDVLVSLNENEQ